MHTSCNWNMRKEVPVDTPFILRLESISDVDERPLVVLRNLPSPPSTRIWSSVQDKFVM